MNVAVIKYNAGNTLSVCNALRRLGVSYQVSDSAVLLNSATHVIFPGVGEASSAMRSLRSSGLDKIIPRLQQPLLGICLGMHLLGKHSEEGDTDCLNVISCKIRKLNLADSPKVPHMGWNRIENLTGLLFNGIAEGSYMYFAHSFHIADTHNAVASTQYGRTICAAVQSNNFFGVQFHPEKSAELGSRVIENFLRIQ